MICIIMAGGKGSRMSLDTEKLLLRYKKPIIMHVVDALKDSNCFEEIFAATSPNSPKTNQFLLDQGIKIIKTSGQGFVKDLNNVLKSINDDVLVTSGDLPFLDGYMVKQIVSKYDENKTWTSFVVTKEFLDSSNITAEFPLLIDETECYYTGISLINPKKINSLKQVKENYEILDDKRVAFNLNTKKDYELINIS